MTPKLLLLIFSLFVNTSLFASLEKACSFLKKPTTTAIMQNMISNNHLIVRDLGELTPESLEPRCETGYREYVLKIGAEKIEASNLQEVTEPTGQFVFPLCAGKSCPILAIVFRYKGELAVASVGRSGQARILEQSAARIKEIEELSGEPATIRRVITPDDSLDLIWATNKRTGEEFMVIASPEVERQITGRKGAMKIFELSDVIQMISDIEEQGQIADEKELDWQDAGEVVPDDSDVSDPLPAGLSAGGPSKKKKEPKILNGGDTVLLEIEPVLPSEKAHPLAKVSVPSESNPPPKAEKAGVSWLLLVAPLILVFTGLVMFLRRKHHLKPPL